MRSILVETGQKLMVQTNNISNILTNQDLSIQVSLNGLSFCILQNNKNTITQLKAVDFDKKLNPFELLDKVTDLFNTEDALQNNFDSVQVIHVNELSTLIPKPLFDEDCLADYLKFNSKILKSDYIAYDDIPTNDSVNVYVPYVNINNFIYEKFGSFTFKHFSTILIEQILLTEKNADDLKLYVNIADNHFEIIAINKGKLELYNTFEYTTQEDFIYYLLFTAEQLNLNPETFQLVFLGDVNEDSELYKIAYKYIRNISFGSTNTSFSFTEEPETNYSNFTLINSF